MLSAKLNHIKFFISPRVQNVKVYPKIHDVGVTSP